MKAIRFPSTAVFKFKGSCKSWNSSKGWGRLVIQNSCFPFTFFKDPRYPHCFVPGRMILFLFSPFCFLGLLKKKKICFVPIKLLTYAFWCFSTQYFQGSLKENFTRKGSQGNLLLQEEEKEAPSSWVLLTEIQNPLCSEPGWVSFWVKQWTRLIVCKWAFYKTSLNLRKTQELFPES